MARIRTYKPEFWQDEKLAPLAPIHRLVFLGLISMADDAGRLVDNVKLIDGFLFPATEDSARESLEVLKKISRIAQYQSASGQHLIQITNWHRHQYVLHPSKYVLPGPANAAESEVPRGKPLAKKAKEKRKSHSRANLDSINDLRPTTNEQTTVGMFETSWKAYPKRPNNSKVEAERQWNARVKEGESEVVMHAGTLAYAAFVEREKTEPRYVKLASTFYGRGKHYLSDFTLPPDPDDELEPEPVWMDQLRAQHPQEAPHGP